VFLTIALSWLPLAMPSRTIAATPNSNPVVLKQSSSGLAQRLTSAQQAFAAGRYTEALQLWQTAYKSYQEQGDRANEAVTLGNLALVYEKLGQWTEANQAIANSLAILETLKLPDQEQKTRYGQALNIQGSLQLAQGQAEQALATWEKAAQILGQANDEPGVIRVLINQSQALRTLGLYLRARTVLEEVNQRLQGQPDSLLRAVGLLNYGNALQLAGDRDAAKAALEQSLALVQQAQSPADEAVVLMSLGNLNRGIGDRTAASDFYEKAATVSPAPLLQVQARINQIRVLLEEERVSDALALAKQLQPQIAQLPASRTSIYAQIGLAQALIKLAEAPTSEQTKQLSDRSQSLLKEAAKLLSMAAQQAAQLSDDRAESFALGNLGNVYEKTKQVETAQKLTQKALALAQASNAPDISYRWQWQLGRLLKAQKQNESAIAAYYDAVNTLALIRNDLAASNLDLQFTFRESVEPVYRELVSLLLEPEKNEVSQERLTQTVPVVAGNQEREVSQDRLKEARKVIESLQLAELDNYFREACLTGQPIQIDQIDPTAAVIYPIILSDRLEVIVSLPNKTLYHYSTPIDQVELDTLLNRTRQFLRLSALAKLQVKLAQDVYQLLLAPAKAELEANGVKTLVFVLDGALRNIPMAILHDGENYLIQKYNLAITPSLQLLAPKPLAGSQLRVLIGGLSESRQGFTPLPGVKEEVQQIQAEVPSQLLLNENFTSAAIQQQIESAPYPIVHLATHGQFSSDADNTFILAWDEKLNVRELGELLQKREEEAKRPIELLVLSACQTAEGDRRATLGLAGVAVRSGARSTVATLWPVDDKATSEFMTLFYQELVKPGATKAGALRQAQLGLLKDFPQPYFWAAFVLVGNWQ